ncbi:MAG: tyrosine-type recombinase/integrase [Anaerorhabdus sp.]|uniref:tyrosine-type recombinase/integrase n=1 Tax=Anaerorhabdus sp. TaxID=1872524 RepID=UPI003A871705
MSEKKYVPRHIRYHKGGQQDVFPIKLKDFNMMTRLCLVKRDAAREKGDLKGEHRWWRNYIILITGANTGHRIERLLQFTPRNIEGGSLAIEEFKTGKKLKYEINDSLLNELDEFIEFYNISKNEFIFKTYSNSIKPLTRQQAYNFIKILADEVGIKYPVGAHSLRKSFGRFVYDEKHDIYVVQRLLGHENPYDTMRYICLEDNVVEKQRKKAAFGIH